MIIYTPLVTHNEIYKILRIAAVDLHYVIFYNNIWYYYEIFLRYSTISREIYKPLKDNDPNREEKYLNFVANILTYDINFNVIDLTRDPNWFMLLRKFNLNSAMLIIREQGQYPVTTQQIYNILTLNPIDSIHFSALNKINYRIEAAFSRIILSNYSKEEQSKYGWVNNLYYRTQKSVVFAHYFASSILAGMYPVKALKILYRLLEKTQRCQQLDDFWIITYKDKTVQILADEIFHRHHHFHLMPYTPIITQNEILNLLQKQHLNFVRFLSKKHPNYFKIICIIQDYCLQIQNDNRDNLCSEILAYGINTGIIPFDKEWELLLGKKEEPITHVKIFNLLHTKQMNSSVFPKEYINIYNSYLKICSSKLILSYSMSGLPNLPRNFGELVHYYARNLFAQFLVNSINTGLLVFTDDLFIKNNNRT